MWPVGTQEVNGKQPIRCEGEGVGRTGVAAQSVKPLPSLTVRGVDVAVPGARADQDGPPALGALHEGQVPDGAVVHAELQVRPFDQKTEIKPGRPVHGRRRSIPYPWRCRCRR